MDVVGFAVVSERTMEIVGIVCFAGIGAKEGKKERIDSSGFRGAIVVQEW
jgi:uncharacterized membrane protein YeiH